VLLDHQAELADRFDSCREATRELFDGIEVFYNQRRRHSTIGRISAPACERRARAEDMDAMETAQNVVSQRARQIGSGSAHQHDVKEHDLPLVQQGRA
jgi:hypothetical protein